MCKVSTTPTIYRDYVTMLWLCSTRITMEADLEKSFKQSFWTRSFPVNPLYVLGVIVVLAVYVMLPIYLYTNRLKGVCCDPDAGTSLACNATDTTSGQQTQDDVRGNLRKLLSTQQIDAQALYAGGSGDLHIDPTTVDPWSHYIARG